MAAPVHSNEFLDLVRRSGVVEEKRLDSFLQKQGKLPAEPSKAAGILVQEGLLTHFQAEHILQGKWRRFTIGKYKVLERLGSGGMASVFLCEHKLMRRRVAVKVLPAAKAADEAALQRFYREARAVAALDHPNIVHAYDIDQDENLHFLVMEYVDGASLQEIVKKTGRLDVSSACHYIRQSALGMQHAHEAGLVHRDIKPANILVDRAGQVKVLDLGLARFFHDEEDIISKKYDENVMGTADYLAPEQALDSHAVDIRADIYSLGATFYFLLTGQTPFGEGTIGQKLLWHQQRQHAPVHTLRADVSADLSAVLDRMMAKEPKDRYQIPGDVARVLEPFTQAPVAPPPEVAMPHLSPAAGANSDLRLGSGSASSLKMRGTPSPAPRRRAKDGGPSFPSSSTPGPITAPPVYDTPAVPEEPAPLDELDEETANALAEDETSPERRRQAGKRLAQSVRERGRMWQAIVAVSAVFVMVLGVLFWRYFFSQPPLAPPRPVLAVTKEKKLANAHRTVQHALKAAKTGDIIELHDALHIEKLVVSPSLGTTSVTLRAAAGTEVVWKSNSVDEKDPILRLENARNFKFQGKGITLDGTLEGKKRVYNLIEVLFLCQGLEVADLQFQSFARSGVNVLNCSGEPKNPVRFLNLQFTVPKGAEGAMIFEANPKITPEFNNHIEVNDACRFEGIAPAKAIKAKGMGDDVRLP